MIDAQPVEKRCRLVEALLISVGVEAAETRIGGIDFDQVARLRVLQGDDSDVGEFEFAPVKEFEADQLVTPGGDAEKPAGFLRDGWDGAVLRRFRLKKIGEEKTDRAAFDDAVEGAQCGGEIGAAAARLKEEDLANHPENMLPAFFWGDEKFDLVGKKKEADLVVVARGGEGKHTGDFGGEFALALRGGAKVAGRRDIDEEDQGPLPFLAVGFQEGAIHAGRHVPVDRADVVAGLVFAHLGKIDPGAFEKGVVGAGHGVVDIAPAANFHLADAPQDFARLFGLTGLVHGTGIVSRIRETTSSLVISSASASYVSTTRWRRTSMAMVFTSCGVT